GILENANQLAEGYYQQNQKNMGDNAVTMASDIRYYLQQESILSPDFAEGYALQVVNRELGESAILQRNSEGEYQIAAIVDPDEDTERQRITASDIALLESGDSVVVHATPERIEAITPIDADAGTYLY